MRTSEKIDLIVPALLSAYSKLENPSFDSINDFHENQYVSLLGVVAKTRETLQAYGIIVIQSVDAATSGSAPVCVCTTTLLHSSCQFIETHMVVAPNKNDAQGWGGASTYARRYGLLATLNLVGDKDDDGNYGMDAPSKPAPRKVAPKPQPKPAEKPASPLTGIPDDAWDGKEEEPKTEAQEVREKLEEKLGAVPSCPECGAEMIKRTAKKGKNAGKSFWGCSAYPACKKIVNA